MFTYRMGRVFVYGPSCLVGCVILRRQPVKMLHLMSGDLYTSACASGGGGGGC